MCPSGIPTEWGCHWNSSWPKSREECTPIAPIGKGNLNPSVQYLHVTLAGEQMGDARITGDLPSMQKMFAIR